MRTATIMKLLPLTSFIATYAIDLVGKVSGLSRGAADDRACFIVPCSRTLSLPCVLIRTLIMVFS